MKRLKDEFLNTVDKVVTLAGKNILEIGCGNGLRSVGIAKKCAHLVSIDPDPQLVSLARESNNAENIEYRTGKAEHLDFADKKFDLVIFTLSLHHVPIDKIPDAIDEAIRVTKEHGHIVFLEPTEDGTFFDAEIAFDACDGDERREKSAAYAAMTKHVGYEKVTEILGETIFQFDSVEDFNNTMKPKTNAPKLESFLQGNKFILRAQRRINIFKVE